MKNYNTLVDQMKGIDIDTKGRLIYLAVLLGNNPDLEEPDNKHSEWANEQYRNFRPLVHSDYTNQFLRRYVQKSKEKK